MTFEEILKIKDTEKLIELSESSDVNILTGVASNECTPIKILNKLANNTSLVVRVHTAENSSLSKEMMNALATEKNILIKIALINNLKISDDILFKLSRSKVKNIADLAMKKLEERGEY